MQISFDLLNTSGIIQLFRRVTLVWPKATVVVIIENQRLYSEIGLKDNLVNH